MDDDPIFLDPKLFQLDVDPATLPEWSGRFYCTDRGARGYVRVHLDDLRKPRIPAGWELLDVEEDEDCETYWYGRTARNE